MLRADSDKLTAQSSMAVQGTRLLLEVCLRRRSEASTLHSRPSWSCVAAMIKKCCTLGGDNEAVPEAFGLLRLVCEQPEAVHVAMTAGIVKSIERLLQDPTSHGES